MEKTTSLKRSEITTKWWLIDATDCVLGRLASRVAYYLKNKHKPDCTPNMQSFGDYFVVINVDKMIYTGNKLKTKLYRKHTGYFGHLREKTLEQVGPEMAIREAVKCMISKCRSRKFMLRRLRVFTGNTHNHEAQQPELLKICTRYGEKYEQVTQSGEAK